MMLDKLTALSLRFPRNCNEAPSSRDVHDRSMGEMVTLFSNVGRDGLQKFPMRMFWG